MGRKLLFFFLVFVMFFSFVSISFADVTYSSTKSLGYVRISSDGSISFYSANIAYVATNSGISGSVSVGLKDMTEGVTYNTLSTSDLNTLRTIVSYGSSNGFSNNFDWCLFGPSYFTRSAFGISSWVSGHMYRVVYNVNVTTVSGTSPNAYIQSLVSSGTSYFTYTGAGSYLSLSPTSYSVSVSYNNDFSCDTETASFYITTQGFSIQSIDQVQWNMQTSALIQSYTVSNLTSSSATVTVTFYNIPNGNYYIRFWVTGYDLDNTYESISADASFTVSCASQVVPQGHLVIVQPPEVFNTSVDATGKVTTTFSLTYGGNFATDYNGRTLSFKIISVKSSTTENLLSFFNDFSFANQNWTYNSANNESYSTYSVTWVNGADLNYGCDVIFQAIVSNGFFNLLHSDNTVEIIVGSPPSSTGNPLLDWLIKVWAEFKQWFVDTLKWLFVPTAEQLESINIVGNGSSGAVDVIKQYMPFLNLSQYGKSSFTLIDFNNLNFTYTINNKTSTIKAGNEKLTIDLNDSRVSSFLSYVKIGADILVSLALILLLYEVLK